MIMYVLFVKVGGNHHLETVSPQTRGKLFSNGVSLLRRYLAGLE